MEDDRQTSTVHRRHYDSYESTRANLPSRNPSYYIYSLYKYLYEENFRSKVFSFLEILERKKGIADAIPDGSLSLLEGRTNVPACDARKVDVKR